MYLFTSRKKYLGLLLKAVKKGFPKKVSRKIPMEYTIHNRGIDKKTDNWQLQ